MKSLVDHEADVNYQNPDGVTPLLSASSSGDLEAVRILAKKVVEMTSTTGSLAIAHMMQHLRNMVQSFFSITESQQREADLAVLMKRHVAHAARSNPLLIGDKGKHCFISVQTLRC